MNSELERFMNEGDERPGKPGPYPETATRVIQRQRDEEWALRTGPLGAALRAEGAIAERARIRQLALDEAKRLAHKEPMWECPGPHPGAESLEWLAALLEKG